MLTAYNKFPKSIDEVSLGWLNHVLPAESAVRAFEQQLLLEQGALSQTYLLTLAFTHQRHRIPAKLLLKLSPENDAAREALRFGRFYQREVDFYCELGDDPGIAAPRCFATGFDEADNSFILLLEFIDHASVRDVLIGTLDEVEIAVEALAGLHARWWGRAEELPFLVREDREPFVSQVIELADKALANVKANHREQVGETLVDLLELYLPHAERLIAEAANGPLTLCHGDYHRKQLLFPDGEQGRFAVLDWQTVTVDRGANDLARIIVVGLRNELRREHEVALVESYHRSLVAHGVQDYPLAALWEHYKLGVARILLLHSRCLGGLLDIQPMINEWAAKGEDWFEVFFQWPSDAMSDHQVLDYLREKAESLKTAEQQTTVATAH